MLRWSVFLGSVDSQTLESTIDSALPVHLRSSSSLDRQRSASRDSITDDDRRALLKHSHKRDSSFPSYPDVAHVRKSSASTIDEEDEDGMYSYTGGWSRHTSLDRSQHASTDKTGLLEDGIIGSPFSTPPPNYGSIDKGEKGKRESKRDSKRESKRASALPSQGPPLKPMEGRDAWLCVVGGFFCLFVSFGWVNCVGLFQSYYEQNQLKNFNDSAVAWITSLEIFLMFFLGLIMGKLFDSHGPRYLLLVGTCLHVFGLMMTSLATEYYQILLAQGVCSSIGASAIFYAAVGSTSGWFGKNQSLAVGLTASGSSLGGVIFPIMIKQLLPQIGFGWTMRSAAFMILGMLIFANLTVKTRLPPPAKMPANPKFLLEPFKDKIWIWTTVGAFFFSFGLFPVYNYLISEVMYEHMSYNMAIYCLVILNAASLPGRIIPNFISDRFGRYNTMIMMTLIASLTLLCLWLPADNNAGLIAFSIIFGFASGAYVSLVPALMLQISPMPVVGLRIGVMYAIASFAALFGSPLGGGLVSMADGKYTGLIIFTGVMELVGMFFFGVARYKQKGFKICKC